MKQILRHKGMEISLTRHSSDGCCLNCFFYGGNDGCKRYYFYKLLGYQFQCDESYDTGDVDEDGEEITQTDYYIWVRDKELDKNTVVI